MTFIISWDGFIFKATQKILCGLVIFILGLRAEAVDISVKKKKSGEGIWERNIEPAKRLLMR